LTCARKLAIQAIELPKPILAKGYNGVVGKSISHYILLNLIIDKRHLYDLPFLILDLGNHDIILGSKWMAYFDVQPDLRKRKLLWPTSSPPTSHFARSLTIPISDVLAQAIDQEQQIDSRRRDRLFEKKARKEDRQRKAGKNSHIQSIQKAQEPILVSKTSTLPKDYTSSIRTYIESIKAHRIPKTALAEICPIDQSDFLYQTEEMESAKLSSDTPRPARMPYNPQSPSTYIKDLKKELNQMDRQLYDQKDQPLLVPSKRRPSASNPISDPLLTLDIAEISGPAFHLNLRRKQNIVFSTSLYKIDKELEERTPAEDTPTNLEELRNRLPDLYKGWEDYFSQTASDQLPPRRSYDHKIILEEGAQLTHGPLYSQSTNELLAIKKYLLENLDKGFIEPSQAPFSSPILFVKKHNGSLRFCIDFRKLNQITRKDRYPLPLIDETLARLNRAVVFTKLDIRQAFHRIRMHSESEELTTFRTRYGNYKCKVLPFGLTNGPATYQRYMNDILFDLLDVTCTAYLDDILIYSENEAEHHLHVKAVLERLKQAGLQPDIKKCEFNVTRTKYLGFIITTEGIEVDPEKIAVVKDWKPPQTVKGIQSFLGFCNFYRRFIQDYGRVARPLTLLTHIGATFKFDNSCYEAFQALKAALTSAPVLAHYDPEKESRLETDASDGVVAAVFSQKDKDENWHPIAYFSKTMAPAELNYEIYDKEMLSIVRGLAYWRAELIGSPIRI